MTDINQAIREEALKRAKEELNQPEATLVDFPDDLALTTARIAQELTAAKWKPTTPGRDLWIRAFAALREADEDNTANSIDNNPAHDRPIAVLDEFIELQKPIVPENVKTAAASLATRSSPAHMGPAAREDAEVVTAWIKSHG